MITERQFEGLATSLETGELKRNVRGITVSLDTVVQRDSGGYAELYLQRVDVEISSLIRMWRNQELAAFSVEVGTAEGVRRGCVQRCEDGTVQRGLCSEPGDDILHCLEALKGRCGR